MFIPGPVDVAPEVLAAQARPMLPHRSKEFEEIFHRAESKLRRLFFTENRVFLGAHSGTGFLEAGVRNLVSEQVLSCVNGAFSSRWHEVALANGKSSDRLDALWGQAVTPDELKVALKSKPYEAVTIVHVETSTGVMNPLQELAAVVHQVSPDTLILVDAVSSFAGIKIEFDAWGLDFVMTSSDKALALPPGLALAAVSDRALEKAKAVQHRGWYFDLLRMEEHRLKDSSPMTPVIPLIFALDVQVDRILEEGIENRFRRHEALAKRVQRWVEETGLSLYADSGCLSHTVTAVNNVHGWEFDKLNAFLLERGLRIANGYGELKGRTFRIAHMGEIQLDDLEDLFEAFREFEAQ